MEQKSLSIKNPWESDVSASNCTGISWYISYCELNVMYHIVRLVYRCSPSSNETCRNIFFSVMWQKKKKRTLGWMEIGDHFLSHARSHFLTSAKKVYAWQWMSFILLCLNPRMVTKGPEGKTLCISPWRVVASETKYKIQCVRRASGPWFSVGADCSAREHPSTLDEIRHAASHPDLISFLSTWSDIRLPPPPPLSCYNCRLWQY